MNSQPLQVYTSPAFLDAEYNRIKGSWFWKTYVRHLENQMEKHMEITMAGASGAADNLRVAAAMASAFKTALMLPELIRSGMVTFDGQIIGNAPKRGHDAATDGEDDGPEQAE